MKDFHSKVQKAVESMGNGPYGDKKTMAYALEVSQRTSEHCDKLKKLKEEKGVQTLDFLSEVLKAVDELGEAPYDDKKTEENLLKATRKTLEYYKKLKEGVETTF